jgi:hypothetical protein
MRAKESRNINLMWLLDQFLELVYVFKEHKFGAAFGTVLRISKCFQRSKQKFVLIFSLELGRIEI